MKLTRKLSLAIGLSICLVLSIHAATRVDTNRQTYRHDVKRDHAAVGRSLASVVEMLWQREGAYRALDAIESLNARESHVTVRWVWRRPTDASDSAPRHPEYLPERGEASTSAAVTDADGNPYMLTYVPVNVADPRGGMIEIVESLEHEREVQLRSLTRTALTTIALILVCLGITLGFGTFFVARPMRELVRKAERIGLGELDEPIVFERDDELRDLGQAMNVMSARLAEAKDREKREAEERIRSLEQIRHLDRLGTIGQIASGVAHELGTPLNVVRVRGAMIASGEVSSDRMRELGAVIVDQVDRISTTIRRLLDYARTAPTPKTDIDLVSLVADVVRLLAPSAARVPVALTIEASEPRVMCHVNATQVEQILTNLVMNAIQACGPHGSVVLRIHPPTRSNPRALVEVIDDGVGIPAEHLPHVFDPFFTTKTVGEGTGLGLPIAHGLARELGGTLEIQSEPGRGTHATLRVPGSPAESTS